MSCVFTFVIIRLEGQPGLAALCLGPLLPAQPLSHTQPSDRPSVEHIKKSPVTILCFPHELQRCAFKKKIKKTSTRAHWGHFICNTPFERLILLNIFCELISLMSPIELYNECNSGNISLYTFHTERKGWKGFSMDWRISFKYTMGNLTNPLILWAQCKYYKKVVFKILMNKTRHLAIFEWIPCDIVDHSFPSD